MGAVIFLLSIIGCVVLGWFLNEHKKVRHFEDEDEVREFNEYLDNEDVYGKDR